MEYHIKDLRRLRAENFLTQQDLAEKSGVSVPTICHAEKGGAVSLGVLKKLAAALEVEPKKIGDVA